MQFEEIENNIILEYPVGSYLYGTNTEDSDHDFSGVFIAPIDYYFGMKEVKEIDFSMHSKHDNGKNDKNAIDRKFYELKRFVKLAADNNPAIVEQLFVPIETLSNSTFRGLAILNHKNIFLHKGLYQRFLGYAYSQKKKMIVKLDNHDKYEHVKKVLEEANPTDTLHHIKDTLGKYFDKEHMAVGDIKIPLGVLNKKALTIINKRFSNMSHRKELIRKHGYDCYHEDTEFLTPNGWKKFNEVGDFVGTFNMKTRMLEFQQPLERINKQYNGIMYEFSNLYSSMCITPNHNMVISQCKRSAINNYSTKYKEYTSDWSIKTVQSLLDSNRSNFHIFNTVNNTNEDYPIDDNLLVFIGLYIGDGTCSFRNNKLKSINFNLNDNGKIEERKLLDSLMESMNLTKYIYSSRGKSTAIHEYIWGTNDKIICDFVYEQCGHGSKEKRLPKFIYELSKRQCELLWKGLYLSDGSKKNKVTDVYYTSNKNLAGDVQILAMLTGRDSTCYGYNTESAYGKCVMYQTTFGKQYSEPKVIVLSPDTIKKQRKDGGKFDNRGGNKIFYTGNVVCFTVPNHTLITRYKGKIAIQGNSKFGSHLIRLTLEGIELLTTGNLVFPLKEKDLILDIKNGKYNLKELLELFDGLESDIEKAKNKSDLPNKPNFKKLNQLSIDLIQSFHN